MKRGAGFIAAWVGATLVAVLVATAAVGSVRSEVTDQPSALGSPSAAALASDLPAETSTTDPGSPTSGVADVAVTTTTALEPVTTTSTTHAGSDSSTSTSTSVTTSPQPETTTTATEPRANYSKTFDTDGGSVTFLIEGEAVNFGGAVPKTGWKVELEAAGPDEVKVKFEKNDDSAEIEVKGRVEDGELLVSISGGSEDD